MSPLVITTLLFIVAWAVHYAFTKNFNYWKIRNVPYEEPTWLFGNVLPLLTGKFQASEFLRNLYRSTDGPYLGLFVFNKPFILIRDLDIAKNVLIKDFDYFMDKTLHTSKHDRIGSNLLVLLTGDSWKKARKNVSPIFTPSKLKNMFPLITEVCDDLVKYIGRIAANSDSRNICIRYGVDVSSSCMFGIKSNSFEDKDSQFFLRTMKFFEVTLSRGLQIISCYFVPQIVDFFNMTFIDRSTMSFMEQVFLKMLKERKSSQIKRNDFIDILNEISEDDPDCKFDEEGLASLAISFLAAGYETTGTSLSFLWYELSCNQTIQERLRDEIEQVLKTHKEFSYQAIMDMKYLEMVVKESLRKYPLLGFLDRLCVKSYNVPNTNLVIEEGTGVYVPTMSFHYDEQYFPNPNIFDPERFSAENEALLPECVYTPFGAGFRGCVGVTFAMLALKVATAKVVMNFKMGLSEDTPHPMSFDRKGLLLAPKGGQLHIKFQQIHI